MGALLAIAIKDIRLLLRDRMGAFFTFIFPLVMAVFFGMMFSGGGGGVQGIHVLVLDVDRTPGSAAFVKDMEDGGDIKIHRQPLLPKGQAAPNAPEPSLNAADIAATREHALDEVRDGNYAACVILPKGFGEAREAPFSGNPMELQVAVDPSRQAASGMLQGILTKYGFMQLQQGFQNPEKMRKMARDSLDKIRTDLTNDPQRRQQFDTFFGNLDSMLNSIPSAKDSTPDPTKPGESTAPNTTAASAWQPITITDIPIERAEEPHAKNSYEISFPQGILWGVVGCTLSFAISFVTERSRGTMIRLRAAPLSAWQIIGGKALAAGLVTIAVALALIIVGVAVFHVRPRSYPMIGAAILATAFCFSGIMMVLAAIAQSERSASGLGWGVLMMCSMVGGGMIPLEFLPDWIGPISKLSPIRWSIFAIQGGIWRPLEWSGMLLPLGILIGIGAVGYIIALKVFGNAERA